MTIEVTVETHATTEDNEAGIATGWNQGRLSAAGREQARQLGARRVDGGYDAIFSSDLGRAAETVQIAFPGWDDRVFLDPGLRECNYGRQNGTPVDRLDRSGHLDVAYPHGESWREAIDRVASCIADLRRDRDGSRLLVIGHTSTRWAFDHVANGTPVEELIGAPFEWQPGWDYVIE